MIDILTGFPWLAAAADCAAASFSARARRCFRSGAGCSPAQPADAHAVMAAISAGPHLTDFPEHSGLSVGCFAKPGPMMLKTDKLTGESCTVSVKLFKR